MIINADLVDKGIQMLNEYLKEGVVVVNFTKQDGTDRRMRCTRRMDMIPVDKQPKPFVDPQSGLPIAQKNLIVTQVPDHDPELFKVWDLDKQAWRSFRYTTIKSMAILE